MRGFLTPAELCKRWGCSRMYLSEQRKAKQGPAYVTRGTGPKPRILYPIGKVEAYERRIAKAAKA